MVGSKARCTFAWLLLSAWLLASGYLVAQDEPEVPADPKIQVFESTWSDGSIMERSEGYLSAMGRRVKHGSYRFYHQNGQVREELAFAHGKPIGRARFYHDNGKLSHEVAFESGKRQGEAVTYDEAGKKLAVYNFKDDLPDGKWVWFYADGKPCKLETYGQGELVGTSEELEPLELGEEETSLTSGIRHGEWKWWYPSGQLGISGQYEGDAMEGAWTYFDRDGKVTETRQYKAGEVLNKPKFFPSAPENEDAESDASDDATEAEAASAAPVE